MKWVYQSFLEELSCGIENNTDGIFADLQVLEDMYRLTCWIKTTRIRRCGETSEA